MSRLGLRIGAWRRLGVANLARVAAYRLGVRTGLHPVRRLSPEQVPEGDFFTARGGTARPLPPAPAAQSVLRVFGLWPYSEGEAPPDWFLDPVDARRYPDPERPWWRIADFDARFGDIKRIWEVSRMAWLPWFAQRTRAGDRQALAQANRWLTDWCRHNPAWRGPNWKCGQEASIRVLHAAMAAVILGDADGAPAPALAAFLRQHLRRIAPTLQYAVAQDNNHGTSEAAALFAGGSWLAAAGEPLGQRWQAQGRRWLENRVARLVAADGSFSQYSLTYHRLLLDTLCMVEVWRRRRRLPPFSAVWQTRAAAAVDWLHALIDPGSGDGPNLGANDGAHLLPLTGTGYRDFRPTLQLASALFRARRALAPGPWDQALTWLDVPLPEAPPQAPGSRSFDDGGYAVLRRGSATAVLRYPRFRFRPSQADALHLDLWLDGENVLRDGGSYSYNDGDEWIAYFGGTASHNTIQFDGRDQMPRLGRFLFGAWLRTEGRPSLLPTSDGVQVDAAYRDWLGAGHGRRCELRDGGLLVHDRVAGLRERAVLRWRLRPGPWRLEGQGATDGRCRLDVHASVPVTRCVLTQGWESRHYLERTPLPVLEIEIAQPGTLTTEIRWNA